MSTLGALRQTCDRCRKLKVRCRRDESDEAITSIEPSQDTNPSLICVRCSRANVACNYGPSQRCGRPPVATHGRHVWSISNPSRKRKHPKSFADQKISPNPSPIHPNQKAAPTAPPEPTHLNGPDTLDSWFDSSSLSSIGSYGTACAYDGEQVWRSALAGIDGLQQTASSSPETWESFNRIDTDQARNHLSNNFCQRSRQPTLEAEAQAVARAQRVEATVTAVDIKELADLHIGIHLMMSEDVSFIPCDDITHVTRCLLKTINKVVKQTEQHLEINDPYVTLSSPLSTQPGLSVRSSSHLLHIGTEDMQRVVVAPDMATVMMILACNQRLLDLFKQVCLILHKHVVIDNLDGGSDASRYFGPHDIAADPSDEDPTSYTVARVAMTTELISHLLNQLDQGLRKLFGSLATRSPIFPADAHAVMEPAQGSSPSPGSQREHHGFHHSMYTSDAAEAGVCEALLGSMTVVKAMHQTHQSLEHDIHLIKESVRTSSKV